MTACGFMRASSTSPALLLHCWMLNDASSCIAVHGRIGMGSVKRSLSSCSMLGMHPNARPLFGAQTPRRTKTLKQQIQAMWTQFRGSCRQDEAVLCS